MKHTRTWTDIYGSACATFEGRAGGHSWLVAAPPELARDVPAALEALDGKGLVEFIVHDGVTPLLSAAREFKPRGVLVVAPKALPSGPAVTIETHTITDGGGVEYTESGEYPEWVSADAKKSKAKGGECVAASAVASLDLPVVVAAPDGVQAALEGWMDRTPHGR